MALEFLNSPPFSETERSCQIRPQSFLGYENSQKGERRIRAA
jgi:hypothetical protein